MKSVIIYSTPTCGFCHAAKEYLKEKGVMYTDHDVTADDKAREEMLTLSGGNLGVPFIIIGEGEGGVMMTGFDQPKIAAALGL